MTRGRKPKERKGYFYENEENAIVKYINEKNDIEKNKIFNTVLYPAFTKMIESLIRRYNLFVPDEEFEQNFSDTISYLLTKINHYKPVIITYEPYLGDTNGLNLVDIEFEDLKKKMKNATENDPEYVRVKVEDENDDGSDSNESKISLVYKKVKNKYKAYSYCGTVCKNYLMYKCTQYNKKKIRNISYEDVYEELSNDESFTTREHENSKMAETLITKITDEISDIISHREENKLTEEEVKVGMALIDLLMNWEEVLPNEGTKKMQKSSILYYLREETMMTTKELRENMKKFKTAYYLIKNKELS